MAPRAENPRDSKNHNIPTWKKFLAGGAALASLNALTACNSTEVGAVPKPNETTTTTSAPATPSPDVTPSPTASETPTPEPTETAPVAQETNPFITERFKELESMSLKEFEEQPREDRVAYMAAYLEKFKDPEWAAALRSAYDPTLSENNPILGVANPDNTTLEISKQQFVKEMAAATSEFIDADPHDYGRSTDKTALIAKKLVASQYYYSFSKMDEQTRYAYEAQLKRVEEIAKEDIPSIDGLLNLRKEKTENIIEKVDGEEMILRPYTVRVDNEKDKWATETLSVYTEDVINGQQVNQWLILKAAKTADILVPVK